MHVIDSKNENRLQAGSVIKPSKATAHQRSSNTMTFGFVAKGISSPAILKDRLKVKDRFVTASR